MTRLNFIFQASPLITYAGVWVEGNPLEDPFAADYDGSFRVTQTAGASATLKFVGTAVSLFGATRPNHGNYTVQLDDRPLFTGVGTSDDAFKKPLWNEDRLGYTEHTVTLTNVPIDTNRSFLDLDFVSIQRQIGNPTDRIFNMTLDDISPGVKFFGSWDLTTGASSTHSGPQHSTTTIDSRVVLSFQGCCVEVYGQYANAPYTVALDKQPPIKMQGLDVDLPLGSQHPQTLLYLADGLSEDSNHTLTLTNTASNGLRPFYFDYAVILSTQNHSSYTPSTSNNSAHNPTSTSQPGTNPSSQTGTIVGTVLGIVGFLALLGIGVLLYLRRRRRRNKRSIQVDMIEDAQPDPFILPTNTAYEDSSDGQGPSHDPAARVPPSSKFRSQMRPASPYRHDGSLTSLSNPPTSQGRSEPSGSSSHVRAHSGATTATSSGITPPATRSESSSRRGTSGRGRSKGESSGVLPRGATGSSSSNSRRQSTMQEEDAGVVLDPEAASPSRMTLPPAYNPNWRMDES